MIFLAVVIVALLFAAVEHTITVLHHVLGRMAGRWLERRRGVAALPPLSNGRKVQR